MEEGLEKIHSSILLLKKWFGNVILTNAWFSLKETDNYPEEAGEKD